MVKQRARSQSVDQVAFANVDLDVEANCDLSVLLAALAPHTVILYAAVGPRRSEIRAELKGMPKTAESAVVALAQVVKRLPRPARVLWNRASCAFNIGFHGGHAPRFVVETIGAPAMKAALQAGAHLKITAYAASSVADKRPAAKKARSARRPRGKD